MRIEDIDCAAVVNKMSNTSQKGVKQIHNVGSTLELERRNFNDISL